MDNSSGVGVLDKAAIVLSALEAGPATLAELVAATGLARPTAHRLAVALEHHRLVARDMQGRFVLGPRLAELARRPARTGCWPPPARCWPQLRDLTGESAQLYRRQGDSGSASPPPSGPVGLRDTVPVGATLTMQAGSAAQVLLAWEEPDRLHRGLQGASSPRRHCPASGAAAGRRASASASRASRRSPRRSAARPAGGGRGVGLRSDRAADRHPAGCTPRPSDAAAAKLTEVLQHQQAQQQAQGRSGRRGEPGTARPAHLDKGRRARATAPVRPDR